VSFQRVQTAAPVPAIGLEPHIHLGKWRRTLRCFETPGWLIFSRATRSFTERSRSRSRSRICRRWGSASAAYAVMRQTYYQVVMYHARTIQPQ
jgi:hypothetical protein